LNSTGKRLVFKGPYKAEMETFQVPEPGPGEILVETKYSLISLGTELFWYTGEHTYFRDGTWSYPFYSGYSNVGRVVKAEGSEPFKPGDLVFTLAPHTSHHSLPLDSPDIHKLPDGLDPILATFTALGWVAVHGLKVSGLSLGESVVIIGQGLIGLLTLQVARLAGAQPIAVIDRLPARLERAVQFGPDLALSAAEPELEDKIRELTGDGAEVVFDATGNPGSFPMALKLAAPRGRVVVLGSPHGTVEIDLYRHTHRRQLQVLGAYQPAAPDSGNPYYPWSRGRICKLVMDLIRWGKLDVNSLITRRCTPEALPDTFARLSHDRSHDLGVVIEW